MIFTDDGVDLPEPLLKSLTSERLAIFVGAGVSMRAFKDQSPHTCYPGFKELARLIAQRLSRTITPTEHQYIESGSIDRVLGEWDDQSCDVRTLASAILQTNEDGQRLELQRSIIRLFTNTPSARIVTTNFDRLLIRALDAEGLRPAGKWQTSIAPALPPVRRFRGICYLHGRVDEPQDLVLTDKDIGRAYMDEGWALRFARSIFQQLDVLFIGYSLEDPPLRYLSLALEGITERERWVLLADEDLDVQSKAATERDWQRRHVKAIWYSTNESDYRALERTIYAWGTDNSRSFLDRRNVLSDIGKSKPNHLTPHELDRTTFFLQEPASLRDFAKVSLDIEWFDMLFSWGHFDFLLKGAGKWSEADGVLVERIIDWMLSNPVELLAKLTEHRATMNTALFDQFCRCYHEEKAVGVDLRSLRRILEFFRPLIERRMSYTYASLFIERIVGDLLDAGFEDDAFWLLAIALRTESRIAKGVNYAFEAARFNEQSTDSIPEYELRYDLKFENQLAEHNVRELFERVFLPRIGSVGFKLTHFLTLKLLEVRSVVSRGEKTQVPTNYVRRAIESHAQNFRKDPVNFMVDLLRDSWEELLRVDRVSAEVIYSSWLPLKDELIERLRIYALAKLVE